MRKYNLRAARRVAPTTYDSILGGYDKIPAYSVLETAAPVSRARLNSFNRIVNTMQIFSLFKPKRLSFWESLNAWIFVAPWILGFILFTGGPILASLVISFTNWDLVNPPQWAGLGNYETMLGDPLFFQSLKVTTLYALVAVPLQIIVGLFIALLLNTKIRLIGLYRTLFYLPAVLPIVSVAVMWRWILSRDWGLINWFLSLFGVYGPGLAFRAGMGAAGADTDEPLGRWRWHAHLSRRIARHPHRLLRSGQS